MFAAVMNVEVIGRIRPVISQDSDSGISENRIAIEIEGHNRLKNKLTGAGFALVIKALQINTIK